MNTQTYYIILLSFLVIIWLTNGGQQYYVLKDAAHQNLRKSILDANYQSTLFMNMIKNGTKVFFLSVITLLCGNLVHFKSPLLFNIV